MADVVFIHGPPASGKYTIGRLLSEHLQLPLFHNHLVVDAVQALFSFGSPEFVRLRAALWRAAFEEAVRANQSFIFTFNPEATVAASLIGELQDIVRTGGGQILFVALVCSEATVLERVGNQDRRRFGKLVDPAVYAKALAEGGFEFPALPDSVVTIDTDVVNAEDAARQIAEALS